MAAPTAADKNKKPDTCTIPKVQTIIKLAGLAQNDIQVANFIANLNRSKLLGQINLGLSKEYKINDELLRKFELEIVLPPDARATHEDVQLARRWYAERHQRNRPVPPAKKKNVLGNLVRGLIPEKH